MPIVSRPWRCAATMLTAVALVLSGSLKAFSFDIKPKPKYRQAAIHPSTFGEVGITAEEIDDLFGDELRLAGFTIVEDEKAPGTLVLGISFHVDDEDDDNDGIPDAQDKDDDGDGAADSGENSGIIDLDDELDVEESLSAEERRQMHQKLLINIHCAEFDISATSDYLDVLDDFDDDDDEGDGGSAARLSQAVPRFLSASFSPFAPQKKAPPYQSAAHALSQVQPGGTKTLGDSLAGNVARKK